MLLACENIHKSYATLKVLDGVSLELDPSRNILALLGPNGAGKTTLIDIILGLNTADHGQVRVLGNEPDHPHCRKKVGVVLQQSRLYRKLTITETLKVFASFYADSVPVAKLVDRLQLASKKDSRLEHLSGGQLQRVHLGCALIGHPQILVLDEPTTGLDPQSRQVVWQIIEEFVAAPDHGVLLTTHAMEEASYLAKDIAIIDHGRIIARGSIDQLKHDHDQKDLEGVFLHLTGRKIRDT
jgi:ABC-2 type transport system ATP-binding protein